MKRLAYILTAALALAACGKEEINHPSEAEAPATASLYEPSIQVDQELNQVTFSIDATGVVPVWLFADANGEFTIRQAQNDYKRIFTASGEYTVRMQIMNASGVSPDYVEKTFVIENALVDFSRYIRYLSGGEQRTWRIDNSLPAHQACGESIDNPVNWWSAAPDEKAAFGLYDNRVVFSSDQQYTFDPGASGTVYVNKGVTEAPYFEAGHDSDYQVAAEQTTVPFEFAVEGDRVALTLPAGTPFPYIPNNDYITSSKFYIQNISNKALTLVWYTPTGNDGGPIAWQYILTSNPAEAPADDPIVGTWVMASSLPGHMACGESIGNPVNWWSAAPGEKADFSIYDNKITFTADGKYTFDPGEDGKLYVNIGVTKLDNGGATADFDYPWEKQESTYTFDGETLTLPAGTMIGYIPNDEYFDNASFTVTSLDETNLTLVWYTATGNGGGAIAWQLIFVKEGAEPGPVDPGDDGAAYDYNAEGNLWKPADAAHTYSQFYAHTGDWVELPAPEITQDGATYSFTLPTATQSQWQAQFHIIPDAPIALSADKTYDFQVKLTTSEDHGSITLKLTDAADDNNFLFTEKTSTTADEEKVFTLPNLAGIDAAAVKMVFDFGGNAENTDVTIREIILREHVEGGTEPEPQPEEDYTTNDPSIDDSIFDIEGSGNLWRTTDVNFDYWFAAADWETELEPQIFQADDYAGRKIIVPKGIGGSEWQGQAKWHAPIAMSASKKYDLRFTISSDEDIYAFTVKLAKDGDDVAHSFYYNNELKIKAHVPYTFKVEGVSPDVDYESLIVIVDLGRAREGSAVTFSDFCVQESGGGSAPSYGENLWTENPALDTWFSDASWSGTLTSDAAYSGGKLTLTVPDKIGGSEWQGQVKLVVPVAVSASKSYDFSCKILADDTVTVTVKLADAHDDANHSFFYDPSVVVTADTPLAYKQSPTVPDQDYTDVMLVMDFGRCPAGTAIEVSDIVLREIL